MNNELKKQCYTLMLKKPTWNDRQIADELNLSKSTVWRTRKSLLSTIDHELAQKIAGKFLAEFQMATDYFKLQIERLEELKLLEKTIFKKGKDGQHYAETVPLEPLDILAIEKQQTELWKSILEFARQGEAVEVMRLIQNGKISFNSS